VLLSLMGANRKLANKTFWLKQPITENSHEAEQHRYQYLASPI
jgi:hypothetical protein